MTLTLAQTVPAALRAVLAQRGIAKGGFAKKLGHDETWLYRRLNYRAELTLTELDRILAELAIEPDELLAAAAAVPAESAPKKTTAGRSTGRRSRTPNPQ